MAMQTVLAEQTVAIGVASAPVTNPFNAATRFVRVQVDAAANIAFGVTPTATINVSARMAAGQTEYFGVPQGQSYKIACIAPTV